MCVVKGRRYRRRGCHFEVIQEGIEMSVLFLRIRVKLEDANSKLSIPKSYSIRTEIR